MSGPAHVFELAPGGVRRCAWSGHVRRVVSEVTPALVPDAPLSKRMRRRWARAHTRGRRGARRIAAPTFGRVELFSPGTVKETAHHFSDSRIDAWLYLPEGVRETFEQIEAIRRAVYA